MIKGLRRKFVMITMGLVSFILMAVLFGICLYYADSLRQESYRTLEMALERPPDSRGPRFKIGGAIPEGFGPSPIFIVTVDKEGMVRLQNSEYIDVDEAQLPDMISQIQKQNKNRGELNDYDLRYVVSMERDEVRIAFAALSFERSRILSVFSVTAAAMAGALVVFSIASVLLARWALRPVERAWLKQRQFVANASHELKTPITVILANMGIIKSHSDDRVAGQMTWIHNTEEEALRMKGLVEDLLFLAKGDDVADRVPLLPMELSDTVSTMALSFEPVTFEHGLRLDTDIEPGVGLSGNEQQIKQLISILLDNAVKYTEPGKMIQLRLKKEQNQAELSVYNEGASIRAEEKNHLFERFYRVDPSRSQPGYGLGLSIAKMIAENHHGKITVDNRNGGVVFTVSFPIK